MWYLSFLDQWRDVTIVKVHIPAKDKDDEVKFSFYEELQRTCDKTRTYHMNRIEDFYAKLGREDIFKGIIEE
jgi:hypothetical protein